MNSNNPNADLIHEVAATIKGAREKIQNTLLIAPELKYLADVTDSQLQVIEKRMYGLAGIPAAGTTVVETEFKPLSKIMGINVTRKAVMEQDLTPSKTEKDLLREKVIAFHERVATTDIAKEKMLEILHTPKGEAILRGTAKLANVPNWRDAPIDIEFTQAIKDAIALDSKIDDAVKTAHEAAETPIELRNDIGIVEDKEPIVEQEKEQKEEAKPTNEELSIKAKALREEGKTYQEIADTIGVNKSKIGGLLAD